MFLAGDAGLLAHFDGARWRPFELDSSFSYQEFTSIIGFSSTDVYAGTGYGNVLHYDGESWTQEALPNGSSITDLWGSAPDDIYASASTHLVHFDGNEWSKVDSGLPAGVFWSAISGSGPDHVVVIGRDRDPPFAPRMAHFDGVEWTEHVVADDKRLLDVWSAGPRDTFLVGQGGRILHFDGEALTFLQSGTGQTLYSVWGTSASEVFAGGEGVVLRFNGNTWSGMTPPANPEEGSPQRIQSIFGFGGNRLFASGNGLHYFDGESWDTQLPFSSHVNKIWASRPDDVLFVGTATHRYDGFSVELEDFGGLAQPNLRAAWGTADRTYAVGTGGDILVHDGEHWGKMASNTTTTFFDVFGTSEDDVFAVGYDGVIMHFNGAAWGGMVSGTDAALRGVWAAGPDDVYAVGYEGTILHYDGNGWTPIFSDEDLYYWHVTGFDADHIVAPHPRDGVYFGDGVSWRSEHADLGEAHSLIEAVHGTAADNMYAVGFGGLSHYDGETWTHISSIRSGGLQAVFAVGPREVYMAGQQGVFRFTIPSP